MNSGVCVCVTSYFGEPDIKNPRTSKRGFISVNAVVRFLKFVHMMNDEWMNSCDRPSQKSNLDSLIPRLNRMEYNFLYWELPWPSGYELRLALERSRVLILVKVIGGQQEGRPVQKCSLLQQSPN